MTPEHFEIGILGSGFGGTLTAIILQAQGYDVALLDRSRHPRFAIGESSTPIADAILADLCQRYGLDEIAPLAKYATAHQQQHDYLVGPKRGFSYFYHEPHQPFLPAESHANELLVAASQSLESADTHWHRASVDHFLVKQAARRGVAVFEDLQLAALARQSENRWRASGQQGQQSVDLTFNFLIDASGRGSPVARIAALADHTNRLATASGAVFAHFQSVKPVRQWYEDLDRSREEHPYPCDHAAVHQVTPSGWMWQLRFDNDMTSVGWCLPSQYMPSRSLDLHAWWHARLAEFPSLAAQFRDAQLSDPPQGLQFVSRLQYLRPTAAGEGWAMLPSSLGFVDPLHSSGIAHTLSAVERLTRMWELSRGALPQQELQSYSESLIREILWIDRLVSGCYRSLHDFTLFQLFSMWYFLAAIGYETRRCQTPDDPGLFLAADSSDLQSLVATRWQQLEHFQGQPLTAQEMTELHSDYRRAMEPYNVAGLLDPNHHPFYQHTAAPGK